MMVSHIQAKLVPALPPEACYRRITQRSGISLLVLLLFARLSGFGWVEVHNDLMTNGWNAACQQLRR
jgi:hypothetical protein